jgi:hypothetical protein
MLRPIHAAVTSTTTGTNVSVAVELSRQFLLQASRSQFPFTSIDRYAKDEHHDAEHVETSLGG